MTRTEIIEDGITDYPQSLQRQKHLWKKRHRGLINDTIILCQHYPVISLGLRKSANILTADKSTLEQKKIPVIQSNRAGGITAHNPGQLVIYLIMDINKRKLDINSFVKKTEEAGIYLLSRMGLNASRKEGFPGVWAAGKKIASIGLRISRGISYHGMAVNINNDLEIFNSIIPCGTAGTVISSAAEETHLDYTIEDAMEIFRELQWD